MSFGTYKIICQDYPSEFILDKTVAKDYFRQFGKLKKLVFRPKQRICSVEYVNEQDYLNALNNAGDFNGVNFKVSAEKSPEVKKKKDFNRSDPIWIDKNEIQAELAAMSGHAPKTYSVAGDKLGVGDFAVDVRETHKISKLKRVGKSESTIQKAKIKEHFGGSITSEKMELVNLVLSQGLTVEDRYRILDARDKLIRIKLKKSSHLKQSATVGTCPDMCPEKERLMRETQHQVALYEQEVNGRSMNQRKAVKQYSRSSADQEAPLPHELRPVSVLQMTMCYLMNNIMDLCDSHDVNIAEWYHFLWDRTRGIRKDITQQELCCQGAVELVEQCARFHIHCSARLVAEDPSAFDQKINTENLTKCLQTLKYMYHDLQLKGETCPNEAEFRAYIILLNLNDGNFMWEVQELRRDIQKSMEVKFALKVYSALDKNNYVGFFKLVYSTTYLNACILMRYFVQVRITAIKTLLKCYLPRASKTTYPLSELKNILAFDDLETTIDFIETYGLSINQEKTHVILEKDTFAMPDFHYVLYRSLVVVESKRTASVGKVVCGKELPPKTFENHVPQNSFDQSGYLICKDLLDESELEETKIKLLAELETETGRSSETETDSQNAVFEKGGGSESNRSSQSEVAQESTFRSVLAKNNDLPSSDNVNIFGKQSETLSIFENTCQKLGSSHGVSAKSNENTFKNIWKAPSESNLPQPKTPEVQTAPKKGGFTFSLAGDTKVSEVFRTEPPTPVNVVSKQQNLFGTRENTLKMTNLPDRQSKDVLSLVDNEKFDNPQEELRSNEEKKRIESERKLEELKRQEELKKLEEKKMKEQEKLREVKRKRQQEELKKRMLEMEKEEEMAREKEIKNTVKAVLESIVLQVESTLLEEQIEALREKMKKRILWKILKSWQMTVLRNKRKRKAMDCSPVWVNTKTLKQSAEELHTTSQDLTLQFMKRYKYGKPLEVGLLADDDDVSKLNIFDLTYSTLKKRFHDLTGTIQKNIFWKVVVSLPDEQELPNGLSKMEETLSGMFEWKERNGHTIVVDQVKCNTAESLAYCIEKQQGVVVKEYDANGIIFIAKDFNSSLQRRIFENLKGFGVFTRVPIVILLQNYDNSECNLNTLIEEKILTDYVILRDNFTARALNNLVEEGLLFLAGKVEGNPPLELDTLNAFMQKHLCTEIWKRANSFAKWNSHYKTCLQNPNVVFSLYNEALAKLKKIVLNKSWKEYAAFPEVFRTYLRSEIPDFLPCHYQYFPDFWRRQSYSDKLEKILKGLGLPKWQEKWPCSDEFELELNISKYCTRAFKDPVKPFYKVMSVLLKNVDPELNFKDTTDVLWTDVIEVLGLEKLLETDLGFGGTEFENKSIYNQFFVVYDVESLNNFKLSDWFYINNPNIKKVLRPQLSMQREETRSDTFSNFSSKEDVENIISKGRRTVASCKLDSTEMLKGLSEFNAMLKDLENSMEVHRKISSRIEENLRKAIEDV